MPSAEERLHQLYGHGADKQSKSSNKKIVSGMIELVSRSESSSYEDEYQPPLFVLGPRQSKHDEKFPRQTGPQVKNEQHEFRDRGIKKQSTLSSKKKGSGKLKLASSSESSSNGGYQSPPLVLSSQETNHNSTFALQANQQAHKYAEKSKTETLDATGYQKGFLLDVIRHSSSEETFDVRSEHSSGGSSPSVRRGGYMRADNGLVFQNEVYSVASQSGVDSESEFPSSNGGHDFQQIIFDESFNRIEKVAVSKRDTGANDFSDFIKAASQLTKTFSPEIKRSIPDAGGITNSLHPNPYDSTSALLRKSNDDNRSQTLSDRVVNCAAGEKHGKTEPFNTSEGLLLPGFVSPSSLLSRQKKEHSTKSTNGFDSCQSNIVGRAANEYLANNGGFSVSSSQSSHKSRREFRDAIRANARTPLSEPKEACRNRYQRSLTSCDIVSLDCSNISVANATFSDLAPHDDPFSSTSLFCSSNDPGNTNPFVMASDFNVANFSADTTDPFHTGEDTDPFHIGEEIRDNDGAWDAKGDPFQNFDSNFNRQLNGQVYQAGSMDDGLIASIRKSARNEKRIDPEAEPIKRDPSPREVKPSNSDSVVEYSRGNSMSYSPQKAPPKAVPTNAILGSMLFRQTQSIFTTDEESKHNKAALKRNESREDNDYSQRRDDGNYKVPHSVHADDAAESIVSSVTEEASSFYQKNFGGGSVHWNKQAQNVLNHYNVRKTLQARDTNALHKLQRLHARDQNAHNRPHQNLSR